MSTSTVSTIGNHPVINHSLEHDLLCDHRGAPYRFRDQIRQLQKTAEPSQPGGIVEQAGLTTAHLPRPKILFEPPAKHEDYQVPVDPVVSAYSAFSFLGRAKRLRFPPESLDLGYDTRGEVEQYLDEIQSARSCNIIKTWLPLTQVNTEKDEGLEFPSTVSRWQTLALREMEVDETPYPTHDMESTYGHHILPKTFTPRQIREIFALRNYSSTYLKPVSPPLSPASEPYEPFMLKPDVAAIDLTSEPSSPIDMVIERLHSNADNDHLDPQPPGLSDIFSSPPTARALLSSKSKKISELKLDLPLLSSSPESSLKPNSTIATLMPTVIDSQETLQPEVEQEGVFEETFPTFLDSKHYEANQRLEQERLNPADALLRLPIPAADFDIPNPKWSTHLSSSKEQFRWLVQQLTSAFHIPFLEGLSRLDSSLKWTPIPPGSGRISLTKTMIQLDSLSRELLSLQPPQLCSQDYTVPRSKAMIFQLLSDEDIEQEAYSDTMVSRQDRSKEMPINKGDEPSNMLSLDDLLGSRRQTLGSQVDGKGKKRLLADTESTTSSSLLSNFMQLRQPKRFKTRSDTSLPTVQSPPKPQSDGTNVCNNMQEVAPKALKDAPAPLVNIPGENCRYIISMDLSRNILSFIETSWPHVELIDRDFTQHNSVIWSPGSIQRIESISPLAFEADVSLCPAAGLIMTTILRVKQKPLPGSTTLSSFRERVKLVSGKYECLYILVSEANTQGEYVGSPSASDIAGYADFVRFATSLRAGISTYLVSGAEETLSKWALSIMSRYSSAALQLGQFLDVRDSQWDVFFRRAGLNICAAQVLTRLLLSEYGQYGLANFLNMSVSDRVSKYGQIMGGKRILSNVSSVLDQEWM